MAIIRERLQRLQRMFKNLANSALARMPVELSRADLQRVLQRQFPLSVERMVTLEFSEPRVRLDCGGDRIGLELSISAEIAGQMTPASRWLLTGTPTYERDSGQFFLKQPDIRAVPTSTASGNATSGGDSWIRKFLVADVLGSLVSDLPVYQLKPLSSKQALARRYLHSLSIRNGKLAIWMHID